MKKNNSYFNQKGVTIVEVLLSMMIGLAIGVTGLYVLNGTISSAGNEQVTKETENAGEEALSALSAAASDLEIGGSFTNVNTSTNVLTLSNCTPLTCDYVLLPDLPAGQRTSPAKGYPYGSAIPAGYSVALLRRWRIQEESADYYLRRITIAIVKDELDTQPSLIARTTVKISSN